MNLKPTRKLPGPIFALMWGESIRLEKIDGSGDVVVSRPKPTFWWMIGATPASVNGDVLVLTHLQRRCRWGIFFSPWQFQLHLWFHWHLQETKMENGVLMRVPNSEDGIYVRFPGWRWDLEEGMIMTGGRAPGAHWD